MTLGLAEDAIGGSLERVVRPRPRKNNMPKETKAWACSWNCGRNVLTIRKRMERHEKICNWNPAMRACVTCKHFSPGGGQGEDYEPAGCDEGYDLKERLRNECDKWSND